MKIRFLFLLFLFCAEAFPQESKTWTDAFFDFSRAGYHHGKELPTREIGKRKIFKVLDFGAIPNDGKNDIEGIQKAVDAAEKAGGGLVLFPPGTFDFDVQTSQKFVRISKSNIVLRGYGEGIDGTILHDHQPSHSPDPKKKWLGGTFPSFFKVGQPFDSVDQLPEVCFVKDAPSGTQVLEMKSGNSIKPGLYILSQKNPKDNSLVKDLCFPLENPGSAHTKNFVKFAQMVRIEKVENGKLYLDLPIHWELKEAWQPVLRALPNPLEEVGIENFQLVCDWKEEFHHHKNDIHDSGWDQIHFYGVENGWVRNVHHKSASGAVALSWCKNCVVYDCQISGNRGHNGFLLAGGSSNNLFFKLLGGSTMHTYTLNGFCSGNVFHLCLSDHPTAIDCHGTLCHHNLFDNVYGAGIQNGGGPGSLPPAHARGLVLYHIKTGTRHAYHFRIQKQMLKISNYPGIQIVGLESERGFPLEIRDEKDQIHTSDFESPFGKVQFLNHWPGSQAYSLYLSQRKNRYGSELPKEMEGE